MLLHTWYSLFTTHWSLLAIKWPPLPVITVSTRSGGLAFRIGSPEGGVPWVLVGFLVLGHSSCTHSTGDPWYWWRWMGNGGLFKNRLISCLAPSTLGIIWEIEMELHCSSRQAAYHGISLKNLTLSGTQGYIQNSTSIGMVQILTTRADRWWPEQWNGVCAHYNPYVMAHGKSSQNGAKGGVG